MSMHRTDEYRWFDRVGHTIEIDSAIRLNFSTMCSQTARMSAISGLKKGLWAFWGAMSAFGAVTGEIRSADHCPLTEIGIRNTVMSESSSCNQEEI